MYVGGQHSGSVYLCRRSSSLRMSSASPRTSWLTTALLRMHLARLANASVEAVSAACSSAGLTLAMIIVFALPPRDSCARRSESYECLGLQVSSGTIMLLQQMHFAHQPLIW